MNAPKILLFRGRGLISALIRWQTRSCYSHAAILLEDNRTIIEAWQGKGVRRKLMSDWSNVDSFIVPHIHPKRWHRGIQFALRQEGKPYDYRQVFRFLTRQQGKLDDKWFCSELVFETVHHAGVNLLYRIDAWAVSPGLLSLSPYLHRIAKGCPPNA